MNINSDLSMSNCCIQVMLSAEGCISDEGRLQALKAFRQASKIGDLLQALCTVTYRFSSGQFALLPKNECPALKHCAGNAKTLLFQTSLNVTV